MTRAKVFTRKEVRWALWASLLVTYVGSCGFLIIAGFTTLAWFGLWVALGTATVSHYITYRILTAGE